MDRTHGVSWSLLLCLMLHLAISSVAPMQAQQLVVPTETAASTVQAASEPIAKLCEAALRASGTGSSRGAWRMTGTARLSGADETFEMVFDDRFHFLMTASGDIPDTSAYDGANCWIDGRARRPHRVMLHDRDVKRMVAWTLTGDWARRAAPLLRQTKPGETKPGETNEPVILLKPGDGVVYGTLLLDRQTYLPTSLRYWADSGDETWTFGNYRRFGERTLPTHIVHRTGKQEDVIEITSAARLQDAMPDFRMPKPAPEDSEYDATLSDRVEIKRIQGYLFVHPAVDGQDAGWFFLDTGADVMCIDPACAKRLNLTTVGAETAAGVVGVTQVALCRAGTFQLGPVTIKAPVFVQYDLAAISHMFNIQINGICGYDFFARAVLDIDPQTNAMRVLKPGATNLKANLPAGVKWTRIGFNSNTPCLECRFAGDHNGFFNLDTGSGSTVDFCAPAVEKFQLLARQDGTKGMTGGAGGVAESRQGKIDWFELGGTTFKDPIVGFQLTKVGVYASPYLTGNIGTGLMGRFRLLIDYANERIAFLPPSAKNQSP